MFILRTLQVSHSQKSHFCFHFVISTGIQKNILLHFMHKNIVLSANNGKRVNSGGHHSFHHRLQNRIWAATIAETAQSALALLTASICSTHNTNTSARISVEDTVSPRPNYSFPLTSCNPEFYHIHSWQQN